MMNILEIILEFLLNTFFMSMDICAKTAVLLYHLIKVTALLLYVCLLFIIASVLIHELAQLLY